MPGQRQNPLTHQKRRGVRKVDGDRWQNRSQAYLLDPKVYTNANYKPFSQLGYMSNKMRALTESQDKIGWRNFMEGYISSHFYDIQWFHLSMSSSFLNCSDWTKRFIAKILQFTHLQ